MEKFAVLRLLLLILCLIARGFASNGAAQSVKCLKSDQDALINFKNGLEDPKLLSWQGSNCYQWSGISCENSTGAVVTVDLHNPSDSSGRYGFWNLSGEVRPSLVKQVFEIFRLELQHLQWHPYSYILWIFGEFAIP